MVPLDKARADDLTAVAWKETVGKGTKLLVEGDLNADYFYIVQEGSFEVSASGEAENRAPSPVEGQSSAKSGSSEIKQGGSFGELALLYLQPRAATVTAKSDSIVWVIDRHDFKDILMKVSDEKVKIYMKYLDSVELLSPLLNDEKQSLAKALVEMHYTNNEIILKQGEAGDNFFVLYEGEVKVIKDETQVATLKAEPSSGLVQIFGEKALLDNEVRAATVQVCSQKAKALVLDREHFDLCIGPLQDILQAAQDKQGNKRASCVGRGSMACPPTRTEGHVRRADLAKIGLLGCGGFGFVELYEHKTTKECYALKGVSKGYVAKCHMQASITNEKNILLMTNSKFIVKLHETYNGSQTVYFLLEPALGGELYQTYNKKGLHGSEKHAKFYTAGTLFAFDHLHERNIIYRDLKPENLLITEKGHVKLTDMGLAKFVIGKTYTTCGTPDYFAPEIIKSLGHGQSVDWWTLGILIFELMTGHPPFESSNPMQTYQKVTKGINVVTFPVRLRDAGSDIVKALVVQEPSERLASVQGGTKNVKEHPWFKGFDWDSMFKLTLDPPYIPVVKSRKDISNFNQRAPMPKQVEYRDDGTGWDSEFATVQG